MPNKRPFRMFLLIMTVITMSGCAGMNDDFSCKKIDGIPGCDSMTDINNIVSDGKISSDSDGHVTKNLDGDSSSKKSTSAGKSVNNQSKLDKIKRAYFVALKNPKTPYRTHDKTAKITIFSYKDSAGNLHETHNVYTVVEHAHWVNP
ncbi:type IV conjugative transfer system lipoprotein TraV [Vibrio sp. S11_S32]|uniref:type IV conjugative transfer system lipoprotein TraV n=1 Tax=Vibrio sp. S11_S32 TaxID=2720225 RepID=UPI0016806EF6|nr:type IV conjugative transfer system lipoprotein TraV [Vibrio sp. S11_S32]MBD1576950.1 type IV conjugative transfer system lipoprotein TraV [Vibrio sp. S11_S32]